MISFNIHDDIQIFHWSLNLFIFFQKSLNYNNSSSTLFYFLYNLQFANNPIVIRKNW